MADKANISQSLKQYVYDMPADPREHLGGVKRLVIRLLRNLATGKYAWEGSDMVIVGNQQTGAIPIRIDFAIPVPADETGANVDEAFDAWDEALEGRRAAIQKQFDSAILVARQGGDGSPFGNPFGG